MQAEIFKNWQLSENDINDINNTKSDRQHNFNTERMTQLPEYILELYEEVNNSTRQRNAVRSILWPSQATSRDTTNIKQQ